MPLLPGYSRLVISENIRTLCRETNCSDPATHRQNIATAYSKARAYFKKFGHGPMPEYLRR